MIRELSIDSENSFLFKPFKWHPLDARYVIVVPVGNELSADSVYPVEDMHELFGWIFGVLLKFLGAEEELLDGHMQPGLLLKLPRHRFKGSLPQFESSPRKVRDNAGGYPGICQKNVIVLNKNTVERESKLLDLRIHKATVSQRFRARR